MTSPKEAPKHPACPSGIHSYNINLIGWCASCSQLPSTNPPKEAPDRLDMLLQNFASCHNSIRGDGNNSEFNAGMIVAFNGREETKTPIDDLFTQAKAAIAQHIAEQVEAEKIGILLELKELPHSHDIGFCTLCAGVDQRIKGSNEYNIKPLKAKLRREAGE